MKTRPNATSAAASPPAKNTSFLSRKKGGKESFHRAPVRYSVQTWTAKKASVERPSGRLCIDGGAHSVRPLQNHIYHTEEQDPQTHHTYAPRRAVPMGRIPYEKIQPRTDLAVSPGLPFTRPGSLSLISYLFSLISITARCICTQRPPPAPAAPG